MSKIVFRRHPNRDVCDLAGRCARSVSPVQRDRDARAATFRPDKRLSLVRAMCASRPSLQHNLQHESAKARKRILAGGKTEHPPLDREPDARADGKPNPDLLVGDGLHMTPAGYTLERALKPMLK